MFNKNYFIFAILITCVFFSGLHCMQNCSPSGIEALRAGTSLGAIVGALGFFMSQKKPRNRFLAVFITASCSQQFINFANNSFVKSKMSAVSLYSQTKTQSK